MNYFFRLNGSSRSLNLASSDEPASWLCGVIDEPYEKTKHGFFPLVGWVKKGDKILLQLFRDYYKTLQGSLLGCPWKLVTIASKLGYFTYLGDVYLYWGYNLFTKYHGHPSILPSYLGITIKHDKDPY